jgi:hypothetical protein
VARTVQKIDNKLPLEKVAKMSHRRVEKNFALLGFKKP